MLVKMELRVEAPTGDEADIDAFCRRTHPRLVRTLAAATGDAALADELAQEALARAWERWSHVRTLDLPEAWCYRVAINLARSQFRRRAAARRAHERMPAPLTTRVVQIEPAPTPTLMTEAPASAKSRTASRVTTLPAKMGIVGNLRRKVATA